MISVSLGTLKTAVRQRSNMEDSEFVSDSELTRYINQSLSELYDLVVGSYEDYYLDTLTFTYTSDDGYALPQVDFYKLRLVEFQSGSDWLTIHRYQLPNKNRRALAMNIYGESRQYRISGDKIVMLPLGAATGVYRITFVPLFEALAVDADTTSMSFAGWDEYVVVDAAIKCLQKEESDVSILMAQKMMLKQRIESMSANRDANEPESIIDVHGVSDYDDCDSRWW